MLEKTPEGHEPITRRDVLKFVLPTLVGAGMFLIPIRVGETVTIGLGVLATRLQGLLGGVLPAIGVAVICVSVVLTAFVRWANPEWSRADIWKSTLHVGWRWFALRLAGAVFGVMTLFQIGPEFLRSAATGGVMLNELIPMLLTFFFFALILLPFLVEFGLMEFIGTLVRAPFRVLFRLPGRSAIDAAASWMGAAPMGVLITQQQYERGYYTQREAAAVSTNFSVASIAYTLLITGFIGMSHMFLQFYFTMAVAGLTAAAILPRVPPLSRKRDVYREPGGRRVPEEPPSDRGLLRASLEAAALRARRAPGPRILARDSLLNLMDIFFGLMPLVMAIGTTALVVAEFTPFFRWLSLPMVPVLELLRLPEAAAAAPATIVGFADTFLPAVLLTGVESELTRFVVGVLSLSQVIYMSEVGALILKSSIPLSFPELAAIFLLRTAITLPIIALIAHTLFF